MCKKTTTFTNLTKQIVNKTEFCLRCILHHRTIVNKIAERFRSTFHKACKPKVNADILPLRLEFTERVVGIW